MVGIRTRTTPKAVIFDLGDVLFTWSPTTTTTIPPKLMHNMLSSAIWNDYDCGRIEEATCYHQIAQKFSIPAPEVAEAFSQARDSLQPNKVMVSFIHDLRKISQTKIEIYAMSNISKEDFAILTTKMADWSIFDRVFTSGHAGMRKPDLGFYHHVLRDINKTPEEVIFIDDKEENVLAAESLGIKGVIFNDTLTVLRTLRSIFDDPVERGYHYLQRNAGQFNSITSSGVQVPDNFAQLLILEATQDR